MQSPSWQHVGFGPPLPAIWQPEHLLGRLVLECLRGDSNLIGKLNPSPKRVKIKAQIKQDLCPIALDIQVRKHVFALGPARVWNAMLANRASVSAINAVFARTEEAWLITGVLTVNGEVVGMNYERVRLVNSKYMIKSEGYCTCVPPALQS